MKITTSVLKVLITALLIATFVMAGFPSGGQKGSDALAQSKTPSLQPNIKMSPDLQEAVTDRPERLVSVIIDTPVLSTSKSVSNLMGRISAMGGIITRSLNGGKTAAVQIPASQLAALKDDSIVQYISLDRTTQVTGHLDATTGTSQVRNYGTAATGIINGTGIGIAILDSGIYAQHHDFNTNRVVASIDFTGQGRTDDPYGHGTHVAGIAAGNDHVAGGAYLGIAPNAKIINVRVLNDQGAGSTSNAIAGIDWCIANKATYNIRVLNLSFGTTAVDSYVNDPLCQAVRRAFNAGLVVCVAAGNSGVDASGNKVFGAIHSPGIEPSAITVGAANTYGTNQRSDDRVASYSSRGPTRGYTTDLLGVKHYDNLIKPDLIAPGNKIMSAESPNNRILSLKPSLEGGVSITSQHKMMYMSGTSMSTPAVAGAAALLLQRNPSLTPNLVKAILEYTAQPLVGVSNYEQGAGELNVEGAVRLAGAIRTDLTGRALNDPLLVGATPTATTTIGGQTFAWGGGIIQKWCYVYGSNLILKYQKVYGSGVLLTEGTLLAAGVLVTDGTLIGAGVLMTQGVLVSDGTLLGMGTLLTLGTILANGVLMADATLIADGVLMSDSTLAASTSSSVAQSLAMSALSGDDTTCMPPTPDPDPLN